MKGVSPLIATVLLIAFTISIAGIISIWLIGFSRTSSETIGSEAERQLICSYGGISLSNLRYSSSAGRMSGEVENTRTISLGNISIQIMYTNASSQKVSLNVSLMPREKTSFNISASSNYYRVRVMTNCSSVYDEVDSNDVTI